MRSAWKDNIFDLVAWNSQQVEDMDVSEYVELLFEDIATAEWEKEYGDTIDSFLDN